MQIEILNKSKILLVLFVTVLLFPSKSMGEILDIPSGTTRELVAGKYEFDAVRIDRGTLRILGDVEIIITGNNTTDTNILSLTGANYVYGEITGSPLPPSTITPKNGADGIGGEDAPFVGNWRSGPGGNGTDGEDGEDAPDGADGGDGWSLKITVLGNAYMDWGRITVAGAYGASAAWGGNGGNGGAAGQGDPDGCVGSGGDAGEGGNGGNGGKGGKLWLTVMGDLTMVNRSQILAYGGDGGGGSRAGSIGYSGYDSDGRHTDGCEFHSGAYASSGHGGDAGNAGEVHLFVGGNFTVTSDLYYPNGIYAEINAGGGRGGAGTWDYIGSLNGMPGIGSDGGYIEIFVKGKFSETLFPVRANGGYSGQIPDGPDPIGILGLIGGKGGTIFIQAAQGILSTTGPLHIGASGGKGSNCMSTDAVGVPGKGGDGGNITLIAPTIEDHLQALLTGVAGGEGGRDYYYGSQIVTAAPGNEGTLTLEYPSSVLLVPKMEVYHDDEEILSGDGPISIEALTENLANYTKTFKVKNMGTAPLSITTLSIGEGWSVSEGLKKYILAGGDSDEFTIIHPVANESQETSTVHIVNNDVSVNPFEFSVTLVKEAFIDSDSDGMDDDWETINFGGLSRNGSADYDNDQLTDLAEYQAETNPKIKDTDSDGMPDGWEVLHDLEPLINDASADKDSDGFNNLKEYLKGTDPTDKASHPPRAMPWLPILLE